MTRKRNICSLNCETEIKPYNLFLPLVCGCWDCRSVLCTTMIAPLAAWWNEIFTLVFDAIWHYCRTLLAGIFKFVVYFFPKLKVSFLKIKIMRNLSKCSVKILSNPANTDHTGTEKNPFSIDFCLTRNIVLEDRRIGH